MRSASSKDSIYLRNGITLEELLQIYDLHKVQKFVKYKLIFIDNSNRIILTDKGKLAQRFGFEKLMELESLEKKILKRNYFLWTIKNGFLYFSLIILIILLSLIAVQVI